MKIHVSYKFNGATQEKQYIDAPITGISVFNGNMWLNTAGAGVIGIDVKNRLGMEKLVENIAAAQGAEALPLIPVLMTTFTTTGNYWHEKKTAASYVHPRTPVKPAPVLA